MDLNSTEKLRNELGINPISWCETPSPGAESSDFGVLSPYCGDNNRGFVDGSTQIARHAPSDGRLVRMRRRNGAVSKPKKHPEPWKKLSTELILHIFNWLEPHDLASCARVCRFWKDVACDESLWRTLTISDRRIPPAIIFQVSNRNPRRFKVINCDLVDFDEEEAKIDLMPLVQREVLTTTTLELCATRVTDDDVIQLISRCPNLRVLDFANTSITDATLLAVAAKCPHLEALRLQMVSDITDAGIEAVVEKCQSLSALSLGWIPTARGYCKHVAKHCSKLKHLDLSGCSAEVTDSLVEAIVKGAPNLLTLDLSDCYSLTNTSISHICEHLKSLTTVSFSRCHQITVNSMLQLARLQTLKCVNLMGCYPVNFEQIKTDLPHLAVNEQMLTYLPPFV